MYQVLCDNAPIYDLRDDELILVDPKLTLEANKAGSFEFKIPPNHPHYNDIKKLVSEIVVISDGNELFRGRITENSDSFNGLKTIYCEGDLAFLNDSVQYPAEYHDMTVRGYLETIIEIHNSQVEKNKQFKVGMVTVNDSNDSLYRYTNWENTMQTIKEDLVDDLGGYVRTRYTNGVRYIDYLAEEPNVCTQSIRFGENLLDFTRNFDVTDLVTVLIPLGAKLEESAIEALEERLTISSVNSDSPALVSDEAVKNYGRITKTVTWDDVHEPSILKSKGEAYLKETQWENVTIEAKAIDLHLADKEIAQFRLLDSVHVVSEPHGLDAFFPLTKLTIPLDKASDTTVTLGTTKKNTMTSQSNSVNTDILDKIENIPSGDKILQQAQENATQLIHNMTNGYMIYDKNEMLCMDMPDKTTAKNVWRFNLGGFGHSGTGYNGKYTTAITMDGWIVGERIAAHSIDASKLTVEYTTTVNKQIELAQSNSEDYTDSKLKNYYTVSQINNKLQVSEEGILLSAKETAYGYTDGRLQEYYDKKEVDNKISVSADGVLIEAKSEAKSYTDKQLTGYYTKTQIDNQISTTEDGILISAQNTAYQYTNSKLTNYYTKTQVNNQINTTKNSILISAEQTATEYVDNRLKSYYTAAQIDVKTDSIESTVSKKMNSSDFTTKLTQSYSYVRIAWNNCTKYIQFEGSALNIYDSSDQKLMSLTYTGSWFYYKGTTIGKIGTNSFSGEDRFRGLVFDLEYNASYMCWAAKDTSSGLYNVKLIYYHKAHGSSAKGIHFNCSTYANGNLYLADDVRVLDWSSGGCGIRGKMSWCNSSNTNSVVIDGQGKAFAIYNNVAVDIYSDIDMHNWDINNQSDARMKKNIQDCSVNALELLNSIELKEFDWIQSGEHEAIGIIAQQLQEFAPELVKEEKDGHLSIKTLKFVFYLIKAIQELSGNTEKRSTWKDPYTLLEKKAFCAKLKTGNGVEQPKEHQPITIPVRKG